MLFNMMTRGPMVAFDTEPVVPPADAKWYSGFDADTQAYVTARGLADKSITEAFLDTAKGHREAQAYIGVPAEQILRLPKDDTDVEGWGKVWDRLGKPKDITGYDLSAVKVNDAALDEKIAETVRQTALALNLPAAAAPKLAESLAKFISERDSSGATEKAATLVTQKEALKTNWGQNYDANMIIAKGAATALGVTAEQVSALENAVGYDKVLELFRTIGTKIGEDKFVGSGGPNGEGNPALTKGDAVRQIEELKGDQEFVKAFLAGGTEQTKKMRQLHELAYGE